MQGHGQFVFLGINSFSGKKDPTKTYFNLNLLQGCETFKVFLDPGQEVLFKDCQVYDSLEIDYAAFVKTDRGLPVLGLRILSAMSTSTGEKFDISPEIPSQNDSKSEPEKKLKAV